MDPTSTYKVSEDALYIEHQRLWGVIPPLVYRLAELQALEAPDEEDELEMRLLVGQIDRLRRMTGRICEVLRDEGWARARSGQG